MYLKKHFVPKERNAPINQVYVACAGIDLFSLLPLYALISSNL